MHEHHTHFSPLTKHIILPIGRKESLTLLELVTTARQNQEITYHKVQQDLQFLRQPRFVAISCGTRRCSLVSCCCRLSFRNRYTSSLFRFPFLYTFLSSLYTNSIPEHLYMQILFPHCSGVASTSDWMDLRSVFITSGDRSAGHCLVSLHCWKSTPSAAGSHSDVVENALTPTSAKIIYIRESWSPGMVS